MFELPQTQKHRMEVFTTLSLERTALTTHEEVAEIIRFYLPIKYIIGFEKTETAKGPNPHYHIYSVHETSDWNKFTKKLRFRFKKLNLRKVQIQIVDKTDEAQIYCTKDKNFIYEGYTIPEIDSIKSKSYEKPPPFSKQLLQLEKQFIEKQINVTEALTQYTRIHRLCNVNFTEFKMRGWMTKIKCSRDPQFEKKLIEKVANAFKEPESNYLEQVKNYSQCHTKEEWLKATIGALDMLRRDTTAEKKTTLT